METIATLALDINVASARPAKEEVKSFRLEARETEAQAKATEAAVRAMGEAAKGSVAAYSSAQREASRYSGELSEQATLLLRNAQFQDQWARQATQAAKEVAKAEAAATREIAAADREAERSAQQVTTLRLRLARQRASEEAAIAKQAAREAELAEAAEARNTLAMEQRNIAARTALMASLVKAEEAAERERLAAIELADREAERSAQTATAFRIRMARQRAAEEAAASREAASAEAQLAKDVSALTSKYDALRAALDPVAAVEVTLAQRTKVLDDAMAKGAISSDQHAIMLARVQKAANDGLAIIDKYSGGLKNGVGYAANFSYQLNDIFTSLASGQSIGMVFAQQGGQIFQIFQQAAMEAGSFKAALAGLWAEMAPFVAAAAPFIGIAAAVALAAKAGYDYHQSWDAVEKATKGVGIAAGQTAEQVDAQARAAASAAEISTAAARKIATEYAATGKIAGSVLGDLTALTKDYAEVTGRDMKAASADLAKAFSEPEKGVVSLNESLHFLMADEQRHIELLARSGHEAEAQAILVDKLRGAMANAKDQTDGWAHAFEGLTKAAKDAYDEVGRYIDRLITGGNSTERLTSARSGLAQADAMLKLDPTNTVAKNNKVYFQSQIDQLYKDFVADMDRQRQAGLSEQSTRRQSLLDRYDPTSKKLEDLRADRSVLVAGGINTDRDRTALKNLDDQIKAAAAGYKSTSAYASALAKGVREAGASQDAINQAAVAEMQARAGATADVVKLADYRKQEISAETERQKDRLDQAALENKITGTAAETAKRAYDRADALKKQAVDQQVAGQLLQDELGARRDYADYLDQMGKYVAETATTAEQRDAIELESLKRRQSEEAYALSASNALKVSTDAISEFAAADAELRQRNLALGETESVLRRQANDALDRDLQLRLAGLQSDIDLLDSQQALAQSAYAAVQIQRQIVNKRYEADKASLETVLATEGVDAGTLRKTKDRLETIKAIHANELKQLDQSANLVTAYSEAVQAIASVGSAIVSGDVGGSLSGLSRAAKEVSGLLKDGGLKDLLGNAGSFLGPIGAAVSAVTGVLGAIGQRSAEKAQEKLQALNQGVQDLRTSNQQSSGSIEGALAQANKAWNSDLEYSSQMLLALHSIDSKIGSLTNELTQSITTGNLLDTSGLGLGTTSSGPGLGTVLASGLIAKILPGLFGSKTKTELLDQGLYFDPTTYGAVAGGGITGSSYADIVSTKTKKFLGVTTGVKVSNSTVTNGLDGSLLDQVSGIIEALGSGVVTAATMFGDEAGKAAEKALGAASIDLGKISLDGLSDDEIAKTLNATFSKVADDLAKAGVPGLDALRDTGEGAFEALTRLAREYQVVDVALSSINMTFRTTGVESLAARDALVEAAGGLDALSSQASFFAANFLSEAERMAPSIKAVNDNLAQFGLSAASTRDEFKKVVLGLDVSTQAGRDAYVMLMALAPAFDKIADVSEAAAKNAADKRLDVQGRIDKLTLSTTEQTLKSREAERAAYVAADASLGPLLDSLYKLEDAASKSAQATEDAAKAQQLQADQQGRIADLYDAQGRSAEATAIRRAAQIAAVDDPIQKEILKQTFAAQDAAKAVSDARDVLTDAYNREKSAIQATRDKFEGLAGSLRDYQRSLSFAGAPESNPEANYLATASAFRRDLALAKIGNTDAAGRLQSEGEAFKDASAAYQSSSLGYLRDIAEIRNGIDDAAATAERQVDAADRELVLLDQQVAGLIEINTSVISVEQAVQNLQAAILVAQEAGVRSVGGLPLSGGTASALTQTQRDQNNARFAWILSNGMAGSQGAGINDPYAQAYATYGNTYKPDYSTYAGVYGIAAANAAVAAGQLKFDTGGGFTVGGAGGADSQRVQMHLTPGEVVNVSRSDNMAALVAVMQEMQRTNLEMQRTITAQAADIEKLRRSNDQLAQDFRQVSQGGTALRTEAA